MRPVRLDVAPRTVHPLLLAVEQGEADRAPWAQPEPADLPSHVDDERHVTAVVESAGPEVPGIEVRSDDYDLFWILAAADLADDVLALVSRTAFQLQRYP